MASKVGKVLVYGGRGALGSTCVQHFKKNNYWVGSIDLAENEEADSSIIVAAADSWQEQEQSILSKLEGLLAGEKLDAVVCVAGGWAGGNAADADLIKNSELMWKQSVWSSVISASVAVKHLKEGGLLALPGAKAALEGTPGMVGYGMAKAAVHHLVKSLAGEGSGLPKEALTLAILPVTLDTPMNRKWMPKADHSSWTPTGHIANYMLEWSQGQNRPANGSLVQLITEKGETTLVMG